MASRDVTLGQFIPLHYHYNMLVDEARMSPFERAITSVVPEGGTVVELGGGTGILSFFAAKKAHKVWCVERNPQLTAAARENVRRNGLGGRIEVIEMDAFDFLPSEPVDAVICEMLHVGMLVERQIEVISSFKERYQAAFGPKLPVFIPEAFLNAIQPLQQSFDYHGFYAPSPLFQDPLVPQERSVELAAPAVYASGQYRDPLSLSYQWEHRFTIAKPGNLNAMRLITKNLLSTRPSLIDCIWFNQYLVLPVGQSLEVEAGDSVSVSLSYSAGSQLDEVQINLVRD